MAFDFRLRARAPPQAAEHEHERCLPELQLHKFSYHEGFEDAAPRVELWAHNGQSQVHFLGPTVEQAFEGKKSFKLDVVIASGSYHYWGLPVRVPCAGRLKLSARMLVAEGNSAGVGFGTNFVFPPHAALRLRRRRELLEADGAVAPHRVRSDLLDLLSRHSVARRPADGLLGGQVGGTVPGGNGRPQGPRHPVSQAAWVGSIDPAGDLDGVRAQIVERILQLNLQEDK
jgi:hypothetical protein